MAYVIDFVTRWVKNIVGGVNDGYKPPKFCEIPVVKLIQNKASLIQILIYFMDLLEEKIQGR